MGGSGKGGGVGEVQAVVSERGVQVFTFKQLHSATGAFGKGNVVGHGSFGSVYRGVLPDGRKIAVKLMDRSGKQGVEEFKMEVLPCFPLSLFPACYFVLLLSHWAWFELRVDLMPGGLANAFAVALSSGVARLLLRQRPPVVGL